MGEYGSKILNQKKVDKILNYLCESAYRTVEDEITRGYILTAISKLHASLGFVEGEKVD